jgi:hypothetical protein
MERLFDRYHVARNPHRGQKSDMETFLSWRYEFDSLHVRKFLKINYIARKIASKLIDSPLSGSP